MWAPSFSDFKYSSGLLCNAPEDATDGMIGRSLATANDRHSESMAIVPYFWVAQAASPLADRSETISKSKHERGKVPFETPLMEHCVRKQQLTI